MIRPVHYATDSLTVCGLSLGSWSFVGGKRVYVAVGANPNRARRGEPKSSPLSAHVTCKKCLRFIKKADS